jgi:hypothetical protein
MSDALSPRAKAFLQSVQEGDDPTLADCERVHANLKTRLAVGIAAVAAAEMVVNETGIGAAGASVPVASAGTTAVSATLAGKMGAAAIVAGMITAATAGVVRLTEQPHVDDGGARPPAAARALPERPAATSAGPASPITPSDDALPLTIGGPRAPEAPIAARTPARAPVPAVSSTRARAPAMVPSARAAIPGTTETQASPLDAEIALLRDARGALRKGDAAAALAILDMHDRRFPAGALTEDCSAERIYALCALGRVDEVRALAERFIAAHPVSPHAAMVRASCNSALNTPLAPTP